MSHGERAMRIENRSKAYTSRQLGKGRHCCPSHKAGTNKLSKRWASKARRAVKIEVEE